MLLRTNQNKRYFNISILKYLLVVILFFATIKLPAQQNQQLVRIAKITVDTIQLSNYQQALQIQMKAAISLEPGVLSYYAVADKLHPNKITILEVYTDKAAYLKHIETAHFKTYKDTVKNMIVDLELIDVSTFAASRKADFLY